MILELPKLSKKVTNVFKQQKFTQIFVIATKFSPLI